MPPPRSILILQLRRVGDVLFTLPAAGVLRRQFPRARIDFLTEKPSDQLARLNPHLNEVLVYDPGRPAFWLKEVRRRRYDWVIDFHANGRTLMLSLLSGAPVRAGFRGPATRRLAYNHLAETDNAKYIVEQKMDLLRSLGVRTDSWSWDLKLPEEETRWAEAFLSGAGVRPGTRIVGIAPASRRETRRWKAERFAEVASGLRKQGAAVMLLWGPGEKDLADAVASRSEGPGAAIVPPETSFLQLAALIERCSLVLAVDNGPKNTAVALGVPTVTIHGPTDPLSFNPHGDPAHAVVRDEGLHCIACGLNACPYRHECMDHVSARQVLERIRELKVA